MGENKKYEKTIRACFVSYIVQAIVNNFIPLLFIMFGSHYGISISKITLLITFNFLFQLLVDMLSIGFVDKIGYRATIIMAHIFAAVGFVMLAILPDVMPDPFVGLLMAVFVYALGGGLLDQYSIMPISKKHQLLSYNFLPHLLIVVWTIQTNFSKIFFLSKYIRYCRSL